MHPDVEQAPVPGTHPAHFLLGLTLEDGWKVLSRDGTEGGFSVGYLVQHPDGRLAFLKAVDLSSAFQELNMMVALQDIAERHNFEVALLETCRHMSRVVSAVTHGQIRVEGASVPVPYIILERADADVRAHLASHTYDAAWILRCLHHITVGVRQLHSARFAHNDLKPANVLVFSELGTKVGDLGKAVDEVGRSPFTGENFPGDYQYAPPEVLYLEHQPDLWLHRLRCDLYQLGGLTTFLFTQRHFNDFLYGALEPSLRPAPLNGMVMGNFSGSLPYLLEAFDEALNQISSSLSSCLPAKLVGPVLRSIQELCFPDPVRRGEARNASGRPMVNLEGYVSLYNRLAVEAELELKRQQRPDHQ
ncbi:protein kinase domain-containing protein [Deinococcus sonorensis]|uniref:Protein kinase n=1 Tax=Deinococcus sonorensis TaxID=309891 RepID=A0ABV8YBY2_9DEIO